MLIKLGKSLAYFILAFFIVSCLAILAGDFAIKLILARSFLTAPAPVTSVNITNGTTWSWLVWNSCQGADYYEVRYSTSSYPTSNTSGSLGYFGVSTSANITGLSGNTTYYYTVFPIAVEGDLSSHNYVATANARAIKLTNGWDDISDIYWDSGEDDANNCIQTATEELETYLEAMSGKAWTVHDGTPSYPSVVLSVNATMLSAYSDEAFRLEKDFNGITITGKTPIACRHGAYYLLDEELGVRWFFKGVAWTVVPDTLVEPDAVDEIHDPDFFCRMIELGGSVNTSDTGLWVIRNRTRGSQEWLIWHSADDILDDNTGWAGMSAAEKRAYYLDHPDYFLPTNEWIESGYPLYPFQLNPANETILDWYEDYAVDSFDDTRGGSGSLPDLFEYAVASITPKDGTGWNPPYDNSQNITDAVMLAANITANAVVGSYPDKYIGVYNYNDYSLYPSFNIADNIITLITAGLDFGGMTFQNRVNGVVDKGGIAGWYDYLETWAGSHGHSNTPYDLLNRIKWLRDNGVTYYDGECVNEWGARGLTYYVISKLLWDADLDVDDIVDDFYSKAFGSAASDMEKFFDLRNDDDVSMCQGFEYLNSAMTATAGDNSSLERIRHMSYWYRFIWKYHNVGVSSLNQSDLEDFYVFTTKCHDNYILDYTDLEAELAARLVVVDPVTYPNVATVRSLLQDFTQPTASEAATWLAEGLVEFNASSGYPEYINARRIDLEALGDSETADGEIPVGKTRDIIFYSAGSENVTILTKTASQYALDFCNPIGLIYDQLDYTDNGSGDWVEQEFETIEAGWYMLHFVRAIAGRPVTTGLRVDVQDRPASLIVEYRDINMSESDDTILHGSMEWILGVDVYFYVPDGTDNFSFATTCQSGASFPVTGSLIEPDGETEHEFTFDTTSQTWYHEDNEIIISNPTAGLWNLTIDSNITYNYLWFRGIPPLVWHDPEYLLVQAQ